MTETATIDILGDPEGAEALVLAPDSETAKAARENNDVPGE